MQKKKTISVIGLGKLGACFSAFCAESGFSVLGHDIDIHKVDALQKAHAPVKEPLLADSILANKERLNATDNIERLVEESDITFIVVPTPSREDGSFSVHFVQGAMKEIGSSLKKKGKYHLFVLISTVLPQDCRSNIIPAIEEASGKTCGEEFGFCYSPSLIAIGSVMQNLRQPDFLFLGSFDERSEEMLSDFFSDLYGADVVREKIHAMSLESAEVAKIGLNAYLTMKITFANVLGQVCEQIPNANVDDVTAAIGRDSRVGSRFFRSGLGFGGPCFPRDTFAFASMAKARGIDASLTLRTHEINSRIPEQLVARVQKIAKDSDTIGVLSLGYKTGTSYAEESQALQIARLIAENHNVVVFDPFGYADAQPQLGNAVTYANSLGECLKSSNVIFIGNPEKSFLELPDVINHLDSIRAVVDPWGMFQAGQFKEAQYIPIGRKAL